MALAGNLRRSLAFRLRALLPLGRSPTWWHSTTPVLAPAWAGSFLDEAQQAESALPLPAGARVGSALAQTGIRSPMSTPLTPPPGSRPAGPPRVPKSGAGYRTSRQRAASVLARLQSIPARAS